MRRFGGKSHFDLPENGVTKPIFYIQRGDRLYFGFTPRLRMFYDYTIKEGLLKVHRKNLLDYSKVMFGYSGDKGSFKSKLSFSDAIAQGEVKELAPCKVILGEPKPTSYLDYLKAENGKAVTYNNDKFELRGVKQYWLHERAVPGMVDEKQWKVASDICPLAAGTKFVGKIRFRNLTKDELGLLLWSIRLNAGSQMNIGKAKAYGYGRVALKIIDVKVVNLEKAYAIKGILNLAPYEQIDIDDAIEYYKDTINSFLKVKTIDQLPHIQEFFMMKDAAHMPNEKDIRYMSIRVEPKEPFVNGRPAKAVNEYQARANTTLPTVTEVMGKK